MIIIIIIHLKFILIYFYVLYWAISIGNEAESIATLNDIEHVIDRSKYSNIRTNPNQSLFYVIKNADYKQKNMPENRQ